MSENYWYTETKNQLIFCGFDNSSIDELSDKVDINRVLLTSGNEVKNLGIHRYKGKLYSSNFVGITRLKDINGNNYMTELGQEVILKIEPRFNVSLTDMLNEIRNDEEFERYLSPQTIGFNSKVEDLEDLEDLDSNEIFHFYQSESPIYLKDKNSNQSSIITAMVYITLLKELCRRPLMGKMLSKEDNVVGKVRGKILFNKNIQHNITKGRTDKIYCSYLEYSQDIIENQILKMAFLRAKRFYYDYFKNIDSTRSKYNKMINQCEQSLKHISNIKIQNTKQVDFVKVTGCYAHYKPVLMMAKMVLSEIGIGSSGEIKTSQFIVPYAISMERLFEVYVRSYLKKCGILNFDTTETVGLKLEAYDSKYPVLREKDKSTAMYIGGTIKPDIIIRDLSTNKITILDVKYKDFSNKRNARQDRLQLLAYSMMFNCSNVGLIFPSFNSSESFYFKPNNIERLDGHSVLYHQFQIGTSREDLEIISLDDNSRQTIKRYFENLNIDK